LAAEDDANAPAIAGLASDLREIVARLHRLMRQELRDGSPGITPARRAALYTVEQAGPLTLSQLAEIERTHASTMTRLTDGLESSGLVVREQDDVDGRVVRVHITEAGRALLEEGRRLDNAMLAGRLERLPPSDRASIIAALPSLRRLFNQQ
jgi:DNA-binding MarR family transcriptional regulator